MAEINRRLLVLSLPGMFTVAADAAQAQAIAPADTLSTPQVFPYDQLPVKHNANGSETRAVVHGTLPTGETVEVHETTLAVGGTPNPPHAHRPSDFILVREGTIAFEHDGKYEHVGPGGVILAASGTNHTIRNAGDTPASYFVLGIGREEIRKLI